jgi:hypothetical protein
MASVIGPVGSVTERTIAVGREAETSEGESEGAVWGPVQWVGTREVHRLERSGCVWL